MKLTALFTAKNEKLRVFRSDKRALIEIDSYDNFVRLCIDWSVPHWLNIINWHKFT